MSQIGMTVFRRAGRPYFECQWTDPASGRKKTKSTKCAKRKDAERFAGKIEEDVLQKRYREKNRFTWSDLCDRYELDVLPSRKDTTATKVMSVLNAVTRILAPKLLTSLDAEKISTFQRVLREEGLTEATIKGNLAYLNSVLRWAKRKGFLEEVPLIDMPKRTAAMKGRPITLEEFERMLAKVPAVTCPKLDESVKDDPGAVAQWGARCEQIAESWRHLLRGLWLTGLRLGEALKLHWKDERFLSVVEIGGELFFWIRAEGQKNGKDTMTPVAPDAQNFLRERREPERVGYVFNPLETTGRRRLHRTDVVSSTIVEIGKAAGVKVNERPNRRKRKDGTIPATKVKHASAHDLRRAFGERWSQIVMPAVLQQLMRHESVTTTMQFYVGRNARSASAAIREAFEKQQNQRSTNSAANSRPSVDGSQEQKNPQLQSE